MGRGTAEATAGAQGTRRTSACCPEGACAGSGWPGCRTLTSTGGCWAHQDPSVSQAFGCRCLCSSVAGPGNAGRIPPCPAPPWAHVKPGSPQIWGTDKLVSLLDKLVWLQAPPRAPGPATAQSSHPRAAGRMEGVHLLSEASQGPAGPGGLEELALAVHFLP